MVYCFISPCTPSLDIELSLHEIGYQFTQLILVAHVGHGVSVNFLTERIFFLLNMCNFVHIVLFHTQCVIFTHTHCVILHTLCNFTPTV